jgi:transposase
MTETIRIGLDLAKTVFQVHGVNGNEQVSIRRSFRRDQLRRWFEQLPPCLIGMEACATAHHWARELTRLGHTVRLIPPAYAKAYVRRNKNDAADAAAICEAVSRPSMRFVPVKTEAQQAAAGLHRVREQLTRQRTATMNSLRGLLAEFGLLAPQGMTGMNTLISAVEDPEETRIPEPLRPALRAYVAVLATVKAELARIDAALLAAARENKAIRRLMAVPGYGVITASAMVARVPDPSIFDSGRHFSASLGIVPRQDGTGGKVRLGPISKRGDGYMRRLLVNGAMAVLRSPAGKRDPWLVKLLEHKPMKLVAVALANKMARIGWKMMISGEEYRPTRPRPTTPATAAGAAAAA